MYKLNENDEWVKEPENNSFLDYDNNQKQNQIEESEDIGEVIYIFSITTNKCLKFISSRNMDSSSSVTYFIDNDTLAAKEVSEDLFTEALKVNNNDKSQKVYFVSDQEFSNLLFEVVSKKNSKVITLKIPKIIGKYKNRTLSFEKEKNLDNFTDEYNIKKVY